MAEMQPDGIPQLEKPGFSYEVIATRPFVYNSFTVVNRLRFKYLRFVNICFPSVNIFVD